MLPNRRRPGNRKWITAVVAASILAATVFCWLANAPIRSGSGRVDALDKPLSAIPEQVTE